MELPRYIAFFIPHLEHDFRRRIGKGHGAEVIGLLRCQYQPETELASFSDQFFHGRAAVKRQLVGLVQHDKTSQRPGP